MAVFKSVLLLLLMSHYVLVSCRDPDPCQRIRNGKVRHPTSCRKYYDCVNYWAEQKTCKRTQHFSTKTRGCVPIHESSCGITTTTVPTTQAQAPTIRQPESTTLPISGFSSVVGSESLPVSVPTQAPTIRQPESTTLPISGFSSVVGSESLPVSVPTQAPTIRQPESTTLPISGFSSVVGSESLPVSVPTCTPNEENLKLLNKFEHFGKTYYISKEIFSSDTASAAVCESICGYLAEVDDKSEEEIIHKMILDNNAKAALVGGTDKHNDGVWEFDRSREQLQYINWCPGRPNNYGGTGEQCVYYSYVGTCMHDAPCTRRVSSSRYICESDQNNNNDIF